MSAKPEKARQDWIALRITALLNIPLVLWLVYNIVRLKGADYATFTHWLAQPLNAALMIAFIISIFYHAALGCHEIIEDYVHEEKVKATGLRIKLLVLLLMGMAAVISVLKVAIFT